MRVTDSSLSFSFYAFKKQRLYLLSGLLTLKQAGTLDLMMRNYTESLPKSGDSLADTLSLGTKQIGIAFILFSFVFVTT